MASINNLTTTRLTGLASGMDTDSIIKNLMQIEQLKVNRELRSRTTLQWQQELMGTVKTDINALRDNFLSVTGATSMLRSGTYVRYTVATADTGGAVSVTANSDNTAKGVTVDWVHQLAASAKAESTPGPGGRGTVLASELPEGNYVKLGDLNFSTPLEFDGQGNFSFEINGKAFTFNKDDTLQKMLSDVSGDSESGVVLNYSRLSNRFTLQTKATGQAAQLTFANVTGNAFGAGGAFQLEPGAEPIKGQNARLSINGYEIERESNSFTLDGLQYTLNKTTGNTSADPNTGKITATGSGVAFTISQDVDGAVDAIKKFIDGYNTLIKKLEGLVSERKTISEKKYIPLTEEEKADMTEKQVADWEALAKKGLLCNDRDLQSLLTSLRGSLYETLESSGVSMASLGLKTGDYRMGKLGEIDLDETTLRQALAKDADQVMRAFMQPPDAEGKGGGYIFRLRDTFAAYTRDTQQVTLDGIDRSMKDLNDRIQRMEDRMSALEEKYYLKFAAMEQAMSELQNQSNNLAGLLGQS